MGKFCEPHVSLSGPKYEKRKLGAKPNSLSLLLWCRRRDLNPHGSPHHPLKEHDTPLLTPKPVLFAPNLPHELDFSAVLLGCRLYGTTSLGQVPWDHHRMNFNVCVQGQEPRLGNRRDLGGILHFDEKVPRPLTIGVREISGFRLQIRQYGLDGCAKLSCLHQFVPCIDIHDHFEKKSHRSPPDESQTSHGKLDSFNPPKVRHENWKLGNDSDL